MAAVMLLGKDDVILDVAPAYVTDALVRKVNVDRYDDREIIKTNLIESYDLLMEFGRKHLPDKFFLEDTYRKSLRNTIIREMIGNTLIHREFTSSYIAKFVIEKNRMYVENANRAIKEGIITPDNLEPNPKNPIIAAFFRNIGYADQLGSGVRNLFKYTRFYSGQEPRFIEGDVFKIIVPLNDDYSYDYNEKGQNSVSDVKYNYGSRQSESADKMPTSADKVPTNADYTNLNWQQILIVEHIKKNGMINSNQVAELVNVKQRRARDILREMSEMNIILRQGSYRSTSYILNRK